MPTPIGCLKFSSMTCVYLFDSAIVFGFIFLQFSLDSSDKWRFAGGPIVALDWMLAERLMKIGLKRSISATVFFI